MTGENKVLYQISNSKEVAGHVGRSLQVNNHFYPKTTRFFCIHFLLSFVILAAVIEGQMKLKHNSLVPLSQQNLIDCNRGGQSGNLGCRGGAMVYAYEYVKRNGGIDDEKSYPYESAKDNDRSPPRKCRYNHKRSAAQVKGYKRIQQGSEPALTEAITTIGPIAVGIDANSFTFMSFKGDGVYYEPRCSSRSLSHAVAVVGYGTDPRFGKYYLIKNSWGRSWGNQGYGKMARGRNNNCGIATDASFPLV